MATRWALLGSLVVAGCYERRFAPERSPSNEPAQGSKADGGRSSAPARGGSRSPGASPADPEAGEPNGEAAAPSTPLAPVPTHPEPDLRVAFLGDQSIGEAARAVLQLVRSEEAAMVVHAGDLSYGLTDARGWEAQINDVLGDRFPYVVAAGNHDRDDWPGPNGFSAILRRRSMRTPGLGCTGELGVKQLCRFRGLEVILSGVGTIGTGHEWYLEHTLARPGALVRLCVWHLNQHDMQVGGKVDEVGWDAYKICARYGAPIITAHEHSYSRTYALTAIGDRSREHGWEGPADLITLGRGRTFVVVSGLGGHSSRTRTPDHADDTWWASIFANDYQMMNGVVTGTEPLIEPGALFIDFHVDGSPTHARAYFKTIAGRVVDRFELRF